MYRVEQVTNKTLGIQCTVKEGLGLVLVCCLSGVSSISHFFTFTSSCPAIGLMIRDQYANYVVQVIIQMRRIY